MKNLSMWSSKSAEIFITPIKIALVILKKSIKAPIRWTEFIKEERIEIVLLKLVLVDCPGSDYEWEGKAGQMSIYPGAILDLKTKWYKHSLFVMALWRSRLHSISFHLKALWSCINIMLLLDWTTVLQFDWFDPFLYSPLRVFSSLVISVIEVSYQNM